MRSAISECFSAVVSAEKQQLNLMYLLRGFVTACLLCSAVPATAAQPVISTVSGPAAGTYNSSDSLQFVVSFSENIQYTPGADGPGYLILELDSGNAYAQYQSVSGSDVTFSYTPTHLDFDFNGIELSGFQNFQVTSTGGVTADMNFGQGSALPLVKIAHSNAADLPALDVYLPGDKLTYTLRWGRIAAVTLSGGIPQLTVSVGGSEYILNGEATNQGEIVFTYTVAESDTDTDGVSIGDLNLNNAVIVGTLDELDDKSYGSHELTVSSSTFSNNGLAKVTKLSDGSSAVLVGRTAVPQVTQVVLPADNDYRIGETLSFVVHFDQAVQAVSTTSTKLNILLDNERIVQAGYVSAAGPQSSWQFDYVVTKEDAAVNGIRLVDLTSNADYLDEGPVYSFSDWRDLVLQNIADSSAVTVNAADTAKINSVTVPDAKTYVAGDTLSFTVNYNQSVTVSGSPLLYLTIGDQQVFAQYASGSGTSSLTFNYVLAERLEDNNGITIDYLLLNGGAVSSSSEVGADNALANIDNLSGVIVESGAKVLSVAMPDAAIYGYGETLTFSVNFDEIVTVSGQPLLSVLIGENTRTANYTGGSGSRQLQFEYQINALDVDIDGINITRLQTAAAKILNEKQLSGDLTLNNIESGTGIFIDGGAPQGYSVNFEQTVIDNSNKTALSFMLNNAPVGAYYNYKLTMLNGGGSMISGTGSVTQSEQQAADIDLSALPDGDILLSLSVSYISASDSASQGQIVTDSIRKYTQIPVVSSVEVPVATFYAANSILTFKINFSSVVDVSGSPQLAVNIGGNEVFAAYDKSLSTSTELVYSYTIPAGNTLTDSDGIELGAVILNNGSINDPLGNPVDLTLNNVGLLTGVIITSDMILPLTSSASSASGSYQTGDTLNITFSNQNNFPFSVTGTPEIVLALDSGDVTAQYVVPAGSSSVLTFSYQIQADDFHDESNQLAVKSLSLPEGTAISAFSGAVKFNADLRSVNNFTGVAVNKSNAAAVSSLGADVVGIYSQGDTFLIQAAFNNAVRVTGTPQLVLDIGGQTAYAQYTAGDNSSELTFQYSVQVNDNDENGIELKSFDLNSGTINDLQGNAAALSFDSVQLRNIKIDNSAPFGFSFKKISSSITALTEHDFGFTFASAEIGAAYSISVMQNSTTTSVRSGTITDSEQVIRGLDLSAFADEELVLSVTLTDTIGNVSTTLNHSMIKDVSAPQLLSLLRYNPLGAATEADSLSWRLTFNEAMQLPDADSFYLSGSTALLTVNAVAGEAAEFDITASGGDLAHKIGDVSLNFVTPTNIQDTAGNILTSITASGEQQPSYTLDNPVWITITTPENIEVDAAGLLTKVDIGQASAADQLGNIYTPKRLDNSEYFKPGANYVSWQVTLPNEQKFTAQQLVKVNPLVSIGQDAQILAGAGYTAKVYLNGQAGVYPMNIPYQMFEQTGEMIESGYVVLSSGREAAIQIEDSFTEDYEQVIIKLDDALNLGEKSTFTLTRLSDNAQPELNLTIAQAGESRYQVINNTQQVSIVGEALNMSVHDSYSIDWSTPHNELLNISSDPSVFQFTPDGLTPGIYKVTAALTKDTVSRTQNLFFEVTAQQAVLSAEDSDGDSLADNAEGHIDSDSDGLADYLDNNNYLNNVMPHRLADGARYLLEADSGTRITLGRYSLQDINNGALLSEDLLQKGLITADSGGDNIGGLFDFEIHDLEKSGQSVSIVIPLRASIPEHMQLRRYGRENNWLNFTADTDNKLYSAPGENGYCPEQGDSTYSEGLTAGNWCIRIIVEDGGINDGDGLINGMVTLLGGVAVYQPKISSVSAVSSDGIYKLGDIIELNVTFDKAVAVTGTPKLELETGGTNRSAEYQSGSGSDRLLFSYTVQSGDSTADLGYLSKTALILNAGSINSVSSGYPAVLTLAVPDSVNSLSANSALVVDGLVPLVTDAGISITGGNGTQGYKAGDTLTAAWDNSLSGDNNADIQNVEFDFTAFGGGKVNAVLNNGIWTAALLIDEGSLDTADINVTVTITDNAGNSVQLTDSSNASIDNQAPVIDTNNLTVTGATGSNGTFKIGDIITVSFDNTNPDVNNSDISSVSVDFTPFGGSAAAAANTENIWTARFTVTEFPLDKSNSSILVTAADELGNSASGAVDNIAVDSQKPEILSADISVQGATGSNGTFKSGDILELIWDVSNSENKDIALVTADLSALGGGKTAELKREDNNWSASYTLTESNLDKLDAEISLTASDDAGNSSTITAVSSIALDNQSPAVSDTHLSLNSGTGNKGIFKLGDIVTVTWNNSATGENSTANNDLTSVIADFSALGGSAVQAVENDGMWIAAYKVSADSINASDLLVKLIVKDDADNLTSLNAEPLISIDSKVPVVSNEHITISGGNDTSSFKAGDTLVVTWNSLAAGEINNDISQVEFDFSAFSGGRVSAVENNGLWTASFVITAGGLDAADLNVVVNVSDSSGNSKQLTGSSISVDNQAPVIDTNNLTVTGAKGSNGTFKIGDIITVSFDNTNPDVNNLDISSVSVDFTPFGGSATAAGNAENIWTARFTVTEFPLDKSNSSILVTAADDLGNSASGAAGNIAVDSQKPDILIADIRVQGATGSHGTFKSADILELIWDVSDSENEDIALVTADFSALGGGKTVPLKIEGNNWSVSYTLAESNLDKLDAEISLTAADDAGNSRTITAVSGIALDNQSPAVSDTHLSLNDGTGNKGIFKLGDIVTVTWNNSSTGENSAANHDLTSVIVDFSALGGSTVQAVENDGMWSAAYEVSADSINASELLVKLIVKDDADNLTLLNVDPLISIDSKVPVVSNEHITISGGDNTSSFKAGDTLVVTWNSLAAGEINNDISEVEFDFSAFSGGRVSAVENNGLWTASFVITAGDIDAADLNIVVNVSDSSGNNKQLTGSSNISVDNQAPLVTAGNIKISNSNGGTDFRVGDLVTAVWDNSAQGDNNPDIQSVMFDFSAFAIDGISAVVSNNIWTAQYKVAAGELNAEKQKISVSVVDSAGNVSDLQDDQHFSINSLTPVITLEPEVWFNAAGLYTTIQRPDALVNDENDENDGQVDLIITDKYGAVPKLAPGTYLFTYSAQNSFGNKTSKSQTVHIRPLINFAKDQIVMEGSKVSARVILNGTSPVYPLEVAYRLAESTVVNDDHDFVDGYLVFEQGEREAAIKINIAEDNESEHDEYLNISLVSSPDLNLGGNTHHQITIREGNIAPEVSISAAQNDDGRTWFAQNEGLIVIKADVIDANAGDQHSFSWDMANELTEFTSDGADLVIDPSLVPAGVYSLKVTVKDNGEPAMSGSDIFNFVIKDQLPVLSVELDSDKDGLNDLLEGSEDSDSDGIPDYLDNVLLSSNVLTHQLADGNKYLLESEAGTKLTLGLLSLQGTHGGALLTDELLADEKLLEADSLINVGGYFDFEIHDLPTFGQAVDMVLPLRTAIPENAVYRKHTPETGWTDFIIDEKNVLYSAPGEEGYCPYPGSEQYKIGLNAGDWCLRLTIEDGGANDADQIANGTVVDPGGVSVLKAVEPDDNNEIADDKEEANNNETSINNSSGGSTGIFALFTLLSAAFCRYSKKTGVLLFFLLSFNALASEWFIDVDLGISKAHEGDNLSSVPDDNIINRDNKDFSWSLGLGYKLTDNWVLAARYIDLGQGSAELKGSTADYHQSVINVTPILVKGVGLEASYRFYSYQAFSSSVTLGGLSWRSEIESRFNGEMIEHSQKGNDFYAGAAAAYDLSESWQAAVVYKRYFLDVNDVDNVGVKLIYSF
ncbi:choice-of-anchor U domain-containing protein [Psychromonas aquimarina]|uniref:choice-of-anchor U domain-containing protein n=1 Tax=Psychromonas aquimarina TaxID=444919 RepID=UPI0003FDF3AA|nr:choice-of-anchor U domain-containing protein [Psychromonas aquimarina]